MRSRVILAAACIVTWSLTSVYGALLPCKYGTVGTDQLFPNQSTVDVWILDTASGGLITPMTATGLSTANVKLALQRAAEIWNEESGSSIRIRVQSTTSSTTKSGGYSYVLTGQSTSCTNALAVAYANNLGGVPNHRFIDGTIELRRNTSAPGGGCTTIPWCVTENSTCYDLVAVLVHELGHGVMDLDHADSGAVTCTTVSDPLQSVMWGAYVGTRQRVLKQWDVELAQAHYTPRSNSAYFWRNQFSSPSTWGAGGTPSGQSLKRPLVRMGSMPANVDRRYLSWIRGDLAANNGGTGYVDLAYYEGAAFGDWLGFGGWGLQKGLTRPVAMAGYNSSGNVPLILVYQKYITPQPAQYAVDTEQGVICFRRSSNGINNLGAETCSNASTKYFGLTAAYDASTSTYLISYVANDSLQVGVLVVPTLTNLTTPVTNNILSASSPHAPSIACSGSVGGCKLFYEQASNNGYLSWLNITVSSTIPKGVVTVNSSYTTGLITMDTPSAAYWPTDGTYRVAYTLNNSAAFTYKVTGNAITGTGDAFNNFNDFISSPVINPRITSSKSPLYVWFVKPW